MRSTVVNDCDLFPTWNNWPDLSPINTEPPFEQDNEPAVFSLNSKCIESTYRWLDRVVSLCNHRRLNLKVSPPYLLDIIPDLFEKLQSVVSSYHNDYDSLADIDYLCIFVYTLIGHCRRTVRLFSRAKELMFDTHSRARAELTRMSLIFSHLLHDLKALFPDHKYASNFRITKPDAASWWADNFRSRNIVSWSRFYSAFDSIFNVESNRQSQALRDTIDLTCNGYVSIFEFDVFTRLFQPWANILETWKALVLDHPGYMAFMTYDQVRYTLKQYLVHPGPGSYVFRLSCTKLGQWAVGYVTRDRQILQTIVQNKPLIQALVDGEREGIYRYANGLPNPSALMHRLLHSMPLRHLQVSQEQYQIYSEMSSAFELCKICDENDKNVQLEPCGHLLCKHCLISCQSSGQNHTCPFCRLEIKGVEDVVIDPYKPPPPLRAMERQSPVSSTLTDEFPQLHLLCSKKPPPVPPRLPAVAPLDGASPLTSPHTKAVESIGSSLGSFCYPNLMGGSEHIDGSSEFLHSPIPAVVPSTSPPVSPNTNKSSTVNHRLNYAQLELTTCDFDMDSSSSDVEENGTDKYRALQATRSPNELISPETISDSSDSSNITNMLVQHLTTVHPDMSQADAELLLSITNNQLYVIEQIWKHFMPRPNGSA